MTLVSSANIMGFAEVLFVGERSFMYIMKASSLELILVELRVLLFPSLRKKFGCY
jgi:hypothetical protein